MYNKSLLLIFLLFTVITTFAQRTDVIISPTIHTVKLFQLGNQESMPILRLNSNDRLELHFDDLDENIKNYYYTYQLCNADWQPADLSSFDVIKGFQQQRISEYKVSSMTLNNYIHYEVILPEKNCVPIQSGNYILKVFLDGDTSQLAFTKRMYIVNYQSAVFGHIMSPLDNNLMQSHQKVQFTVDVSQMNIPNPIQQIKVAIAQNYKWDEARTNLQPTFIRGNTLEYDGEGDCIYEAGKEFRPLDVMSYRFMSYQIKDIDKAKVPYTVILHPDGNRIKHQYAFYVDYNGWMDIGSSEAPYRWYQTDYANVLFTYIPDNKDALTGKDVYLVGEMTQNKFDETSKLTYNEQKGIYEKVLFLKQGFYSYKYASKDNRHPEIAASEALTEGNYWETENDYTIFVYYHSYSGRHDELIGLASLNSRTNRSGL